MGADGVLLCPQFVQVVQDPCSGGPVTYLLGPTASVVSGQLAAVAAAPGHDVTLDCELRDTEGEGTEGAGADPPGQLSIRSCASVLNVVSNVQLSNTEVVSARQTKHVPHPSAWPY